VRDTSGAVVPGATVHLVQVNTHLERTVKTDQAGDFVAVGMEPGEYTLRISANGFKTLERTGIVVPLGLRVPVPNLVLDVGGISETVSVTAEGGAIVQTQSAERAGLVTSTDLQQLQILGRNPPSLVQLVPGVVLQSDPSQLARSINYVALGGRYRENSFEVNGVPINDIDDGLDIKLGVSMDAVQEMRVLTTNYQAEYGRALGANVELITKSGTTDFHGLGSYFKRHEEFNANNFFNNLNGVPKPVYRYNTWTYAIGGPVYIPRHFNSSKSKLFFFWSQEFWPLSQAQTGSVTVPTDLERAGNFSQSFNQSRQLYIVKDPTTGAPFPGNTIPTNRLDANGLAMLKFFPEPNFNNLAVSGGAYNYVFTTPLDSPTQTHTLKLDYNLNQQNFVTFSFNLYPEKNSGSIGVPGTSPNWPNIERTFEAHNKSLALRYTHLFSPSIVSESHIGFFSNPETIVSPQDSVAANQRSTVGFNVSQFSPVSNSLNLMPNANFGGIPNAATLVYQPSSGANPFVADGYHTINVKQNVSIIRGPHTIKVGFSYEHHNRNSWLGGQQYGQYDFTPTSANPLDTGYAYSNVALGVFNSYTETTGNPYALVRERRLEGYVQDNWRLSKHFTLDFGLRLSYLPAIFAANNYMAAFLPSLYDPTQKVRLIQPALNAQGQRVGVDPGTGILYPAVNIGNIAPNSGNPANGSVTPAGAASLPRGIQQDRGVQWGPRFGFAYDPTGDGKTAIRSGIGFFYSPPTLGPWENLFALPPIAYTPTVYYGTFSNLLSSVGLSPINSTYSIDQSGKVPTAMNFSFSVQRDMGFGTVLDVAYVGALGRHLYWNRNYNSIPYGADYVAANSDPTRPGNPLPPAFLYQFTGYSNITALEPASSSNYHSLQVSGNRRFARGLQFGFAWTWSKAMEFAGNTLSKTIGGTLPVNGTVSYLLPPHVRNYGLSAFDRTHVVKINYLYDFPNMNGGSKAVRSIVNNWELSGITTFQSGAPTGVNLTTTTGLDVSGSPTDPARPDLVANAVLPKDQRTFNEYFNTAAFALPALGTPGNAATTEFRGPGINNWDLSLFKNFPIKDRAKFQFRAEAYNTFNHTQFNTVNNTAQFTPAGVEANSNLGKITSARNPRIMQFALRFLF
jgi:hypothetical protein